MSYPFNQKKLDDWCAGLRKWVAKDPDKWNLYDGQIRLSLAIYTAHLRTIPGYVEPDANKIKAMLWTETGANIDDWLTAPMQIGIRTDPGLHELLTSAAGRIILPKQYQLLFNESNVPHNGNLNVAAGIGYLLKILARFGMVPAEPVPSYTALPPLFVRPLLGLSGPISKDHAHKPKPKMKLGITGWRTLDFAFVGQHYNVGDGNYAGKLQCAYDIALAEKKGKLP